MKKYFVILTGIALISLFSMSCAKECKCTFHDENGKHESIFPNIYGKCEDIDVTDIDGKVIGIAKCKSHF